jgi:small-conductance mechanosensitive channel
MELAGIGTEQLVGTLLALAIPVVLAYGVSWTLKRISRRAAPDHPEETTAHALRLPVMLLGWILGIYLLTAVFRTYPWPAVTAFNWGFVDLWLRALGTLVGFLILFRLVVYGAGLSTRRVGVDAGSILLIRKILAAVFIGLAVVTILNQFGIAIGPVLASLGVAGIAVALALQDTLGNYFAGVMIVIDKPFRPGDYVKLESGLEGFVESIGWRTTRIKPFGETTVVVPNSNLTTSILTNNYYPDLAVRVYVDCGVSYASDLEHVERVCIEVGQEVARRVQGADTEWLPVVRYKEFGDSNIAFTIVLRSLTFADSFLLRHEFIKALHRRFGDEGIVINYPVRVLANYDRGLRLMQEEQTSEESSPVLERP